MIKKHFKSLPSLIINHAGMILIGVLLLTLILGYQARYLKFHIGFDYLLPANNPRIETLNHILDEFHNDANIFLLVSGEENDLRSFSSHIEPLLESFEEWISDVRIQIPLDFKKKNNLKIMKIDLLNNLKEMYSDPNLIPFLINLNDFFEKTYLYPQKELKLYQYEKDIIEFLERIQMFIAYQAQVYNETSDLDVGQQAVDAIIFGDGLSLSNNKDMLLVIIEPKFNMHIPISELINNVNGIEQIVNKSAIETGVDALLLGPHVLVRDNYKTLLDNIWYSAMLSIIGIFCILILYFRLWTIPFLCVSMLLVSIIWILGICSFFMEGINLIFIPALIISTIFCVGNCILFISEYLRNRKKGLNIENSMREALHCTVFDKVKGSIVVVIVFLSLMFIKIKVCQDLGFLSSVGIITILILTITFVPSILIMLERWKGDRSEIYSSYKIPYLCLSIVGIRWILKFRWIALVCILLITGILCYQGVQLEIDEGLSYLNMDSLDALNNEHKLIDTFDISSATLFITTDNLDTARTITALSRSLMNNGIVDCLSDYVPNEALRAERFHYLKELNRKVKSRELRKQLSKHDMHIYRNEIERLEANIIELQDFSIASGKYKIYEKTIQMVGNGMDSNYQGSMSHFINSLDTNMNRKKLTYFQDQFSKAFKSTILTMANTEPLTLHNLPSEIKDRFVGKSEQSFRINIYTHENIWNNDNNIKSFIDEVSISNQKITGLPVIFIELKKRMSSYGYQPLQFLIVIMVVSLLVCLRSIKHAFIILISFGFGIVCVMGSLALCDIPLSMINICNIPIMFSINLNNGIQLIERWKHDRNLDVIYLSIERTMLLILLVVLGMSFPYLFLNYVGLSSVIYSFVIFLICGFLAPLVIIPVLLFKNISK